MADLLECLIQIGALRETLALAETGTLSVSGHEPADPAHACAWQRMCGAERSYAIALGRDIGDRSGAVSPSEDPIEGIAEFRRLRRANLSVLDACTAARLAAPVEWPDRRAVTVADLVAIMLASDTEVLGALRAARSVPESRDAT